jgi:RHS repeat-associated protein
MSSAAPVFAAPVSAAEEQPEVVLAPSAGGTESTVCTEPRVLSEVVDRRTACATHYRLSNGQYRAVISLDPQRYQDEHGSWQAIDPSFVPSQTKGRFRTAGTAARVEVGPAGGWRSAVTIEGPTYSAGLDLEGAPPRAPKVFGRFAGYTDVATDTALLYQSNESGLKETLLLASDAAPAAYSFRISAEGARVRRTQAGQWALYPEGSDSPAIGMGSLAVWDSSVDSEGAPARCSQAQMRVTPTKTGATVTYRLPDEWLRAPERVFPVYVDPSLTVYSGQDTYVAEAQPDASFETTGVMRTGYWGSDYGNTRALLQFDTSSLSGTSITSATVQVYCIYSQSATSVCLARATDAWWQGSTWNTKPSGVYVSSTSGVNSGTWFSRACGSMVQGWVDDPDSNYGVYLYQNETAYTVTGRKYWASRDWATTSQRPKLIVDYSGSAPSAVTSATAQATPLAWWRSTDTNGDGVGETANDVAGQGRGTVSLDWARSPRAAYYKVMQFDGRMYQGVGRVEGSATTSWSSYGMGIYLPDSAINALAANYTGNPYTRACSPRAASQLQSLALYEDDGTALAGTGLVATDGRLLFVRAWGSFAGPTAWGVFGSGLGGTTAGEPIAWLTPAPRDNGVTPDQEALSAFCLDGFLYSGYAVDASAISGIWVRQFDNDLFGPDWVVPYDTSSTRTLRFVDSSGQPKPLLDRISGSEITGPTREVMLACDGERIYSIGSGIDGAFDGWTIRVYDRDGVWMRDAEIHQPSFDTRGLLADGESLYLMEWSASDSARVVKVRSSDLTVGGQWTINQGTTRVDGGCYDPVNGCFWLGSRDTKYVYRYEGSGLDLRDNPNPLYKKMSGGLDRLDYYFKIVPGNAIGEAALSSCATISVTLPNRTLGLNSDVRHTTVDLGTAAGHSIQAVVDSASADPQRMQVDVTDLSVASWGPEAALSRVYRSDLTTSTTFAPGWRFGFERRIITSPGTATVTYLDEAGDARRFVLADGEYQAPTGCYSSLSTGTTGLWGDALYFIKDPDRTVSTFDASGTLTQVADRNGNTVTYDRSAPDELDVTAANGQRIAVAMDSQGKVSRADCVTGDGTRSVLYASSPVPSATYYPGTADEYTVRYDYSGSRLSTLSVPGFPGDVLAEWGFSFDGSGRSTSVRYPGSTSDSKRRADISYLSGASGVGTATVTRFGEVQASGGLTSTVATITESLGYNPTGTLARRGNPKTSTETTALTTFAYDGYNNQTSETSPRGKTTTQGFDPRGNTLWSKDTEGHTTAYAYDADDNCVRETDPRGCTTYRAFDAAGNQISEEKVLDSYGNRSRTAWEHDGRGLVTSERQRISANDEARTDYSDFAPSGQPQSTIQRGVRLAEGDTPIDLETTEEYDEFGGLLSKRNAAAEYEQTDCVYSPAGRLLQSADASGTITRTRHDVLGNAIETSRAARADAADWSATTYRPTGEALGETTYANESGSLVANDKTHVFDALGRESATIDAVEGTTTQLLDACGNTLTQWSAGADTSSRSAANRSYFDADGNETRSIEPGCSDTGGTLSVFDTDGKTLSRKEPDGVATTFAYDEGDNVEGESVTFDGGYEDTGHFYDVAGRETMTTVNTQGGWWYGTTTTQTLDALGRATSTMIDDHANGIDRREGSTLYNTLGWKLSETDNDGVLSSWRYDRAGRVLAETVGGKTTQHQYDGCGRETLLTTPEGETISTTYDPFGRPKRETQLAVDGVGVKRDVETHYDVAGRVTAIDDHTTGLSRTQTYSERSSIPQATALNVAGIAATSTATNAGKELSVQVGFDTTGGVRSATRAVTAWDAALRPVKSSWATTPGASLVASRAYDAAGRLSAQGGLGFGASGATYAYSAKSGLKTSETWNLSLGGSLTQRYGYTPDGRLSAYWRTGDAATSTFAWSPLGNIATMTAPSGTIRYYYDSGNRLIRDVGPLGTTYYSWDATRGLRTRTDGPSQDWDYTFDDAGRLERIVGSGASSVAATMTYDANGQRIRSLITAAGATTDTRYLYEGICLHALCATSTNAAGSITATWALNYLYDGDGALYGALYRASDVPAPVLVGMVTTDRGDVVELTDEAGAVFARYNYGVWGAAKPVTTAATSRIDAATAGRIASRQVLGYAGCCYDAPMGLFYLSARYYDPTTRQFLSKDPEDADGEQSSYQYCGGDPVGKSDPSGEAAEEVRLAVPAFHAQFCCWSGAMNSVLHYFLGHWVDERRLIRHVHGVVADRWDDRGATTSQVQECFRAWGIRSEFRRAGLSWGELKQQLRSGRPVYVDWTESALTDLYDPFKEHAHAVVIMGYRERGSSRRVLFQDPARAGWVSMTLHEFRNSRGDHKNWFGGSRGRYYKFRWMETLFNLRKS